MPLPGEVSSREMREEGTEQGGYLQESPVEMVEMR
jgi:hypothetical protein